MFKGETMYLGCDLSLAGSGIVLIDDNYAIIDHVLLTSKHTGVERLAYLKYQLSAFLEKYTITFCAVEGGAYHEIGRIYQIGQWAGVVHLLLFEHNIPFIEVAPLQVKKYVSGKGQKVTKQLVILDVYKNFNVEFRDDNLADAYVLSRIAHDYSFAKQHREILSLTQYRKEVIDKLLKSYVKSNELL